MLKHEWIAALSLLAGACVDDGRDGMEGPPGAAGGQGAMGAPGEEGPAGPELAPPALYTLSNAAAGNQVAAYLRASNGNLSREGRFDTGAVGSGGGLGSQGALAFDAKSQRFFAVNAGSDSISMLTLDADGALVVRSTVPSGGTHPVSITARGGIVYVVNQGATTGTPVAPNLSGFQVQGEALVSIAGSTRPLSATGDVHPTDIAFTPNGRFLVVTERFANKLDTFAVANGVAQPGNFQTSAGGQPFAFDFSPEGFLVVAEVGTGGPGGSTASSYAISDGGALSPITSALPTLQTAACWIAMAGGYAYVSNAGSANLTGLVVSETGALALHDASGVTATTAAGSIDIAVAPDRGFLYAIAGNPRQLFTFAIRADGSLSGLPALPNAPAAAAGLVAR